MKKSHNIPLTCLFVCLSCWSLLSLTLGNLIPPHAISPKFSLNSESIYYYGEMHYEGYICCMSNITRIAPVIIVIICFVFLPQSTDLHHPGPPPPTPGTNALMNACLKESFSSFKKEQERLGIPRGRSQSHRWSQMCALYKYINIYRFVAT